MRVSISCVAIAVLWPAVALAQTTSLSEAEALARLSADSPVVRAARSGIEVARAEVIAAGRWPNPRVTLNREAVSGVTEQMVMVTQPLPINGRRGLDVDAAEKRVESVTSRADDRVRRLRADLRAAFTDLWVAQTRERELARQQEQIRGLAETLARREAAGDAAGFDRLRADREVLEIETTRAAAAAERARAQARLVSFFAAPSGAIEAVRPSSTPTAVPSEDDLMARAEGVRGELIALRHDLEAAQFAERAANRLTIPEPEVAAGTKSSNASGGDLGSVLSVLINVPLFDRGRPERAAAQARASQARAESEALGRAIRAEIAAWRSAVIERRAIADRYRAVISANANQIERIAQVSYDAGERGILELLDAYRVAASARIRQIDLDAAVREAEIELEFVSGWDLP